MRSASTAGPAATPALDRLAAEGVRFDFAHAHAVLTLASHASILTGQYPFQHGVRDNSGYRLPSGARTAATLLKQAGYETAAFVAAYPVHARFGLNAGFDVYDDRFGDRPGAGRFLDARAAGVGSGPAGARLDRQSRRRQRRRGAGSRPWFVWVHVFDPHAPYRPPGAVRHASTPHSRTTEKWRLSTRPSRRCSTTCARSAQPTLVIVTGNHGEGLGDHGEAAHGIFAYESTLRVPLIMAELGGRAAASRPARAGEVSSVPARHVDILPTILDAIDRAVPADLPGRTLLPREERRAGAAPRTSYFEAMSGMLNHGWAPLSGVLADRDKLIDLPIAERYDLSAGSPGAGEPVRPHAGAGSHARSGPGRIHAHAARRARDRETPRPPRNCARSGTSRGRRPPKTRYTEADDPKRLMEIDDAIHRALDASSAGRFDEAARIYQQVIDRRPDMAIAYRHLALHPVAAGRSGAGRQACCARRPRAASPTRG